MRKLLIITFITLLVSCNQKNEREPQKIKEVYTDTPFIQEYHDGYIVKENDREANDVRAIKPDDDGNVWIATKGGVYRKEKGNRFWELMIKGDEKGPAYDIETDNAGNIWIAAWNGVYKNTNGDIVKVNGLEPPVAKIVCDGDKIYALGPYGVWVLKNDSWIKKDYKAASSVRDAVPDGNGGLWIGTDVGLYHCNNGESKVYRDTTDLISAYVESVAYDADGKLWVGGLGGVTIRDANGKIGEKRPEDGITNSFVNVVRKAPDGRMWVGTEYGITRFTLGEKEYSVRLSKRWLMSDRVRDIAFDKAGNAWIATSAGVSAIRVRKMTLVEKADFFYDKLIRRHVREPWIVNRFRLEIPGDTSSIVEEDDDNDGEYTSEYLAMESFRYAATKDPVAKERAKKAFEFLRFLQTVTGTDGFFARTIVPPDWKRMHDGNRTFTPQQIADEKIKDPRFKPVELRWRLSKDGKWLWKGDTSSDEMAGHLFGYFCYYNLVADENEKKIVAEHYSRIIDHLMKNDYNLVDIDGTYTHWGVWSPNQLNGDPEWAPERDNNSFELLGYLKFAYGITGNEKYQKAYLEMINKHGYLENAKRMLNPNPAFDTFFDIYLQLYVFPSLIMYEDDPALKKEYEVLLQKWFEKYKVIKSPFVNFTYNWLTGRSDELDNSVFFLKDAPLSLVDWYIDLGRREDLQVVRRPYLENLQVELRPPSEYRTIRWDKNPYYAVTGNPAEEKDPTYWLLPYWMGRYLELIK